MLGVENNSAIQRRQTVLSQSKTPSNYDNHLRSSIPINQTMGCHLGVDCLRLNHHFTGGMGADDNQLYHRRQFQLGLSVQRVFCAGRGDRRRRRWRRLQCKLLGRWWRCRRFLCALLGECCARNDIQFDRGCGWNGWTDFFFARRNGRFLLFW